MMGLDEGITLWAALMDGTQVVGRVDGLAVLLGNSLAAVMVVLWGNCRCGNSTLHSEGKLVGQ